MHIAAPAAPVSDVRYRERLSPSLWTLLSSAVIAPMVALVFVPLDATIALAAGIAVAAVLIGLLVFASPVVEVRAGDSGSVVRISRWISSARRAAVGR